MVQRTTLNMADIARQAGVSIASVSRALSGAPGVSPETRKHIRSLAHDLGYTVSPDAARLARGTSGRVAVVTPNLSHWFYSAMLDGIVTALHEVETDVLLYEVKHERERTRFFAELPARRQVDALVLIALPISDEERQRLDKMEVAVVMAGGVLGDHPHVRVDDVAIADQAASHLLVAGHERIGLIGSGGTWVLPYAAPAGREQGYRRAMDRWGVPVREDLVVRPVWGTGGGAEGMAQLLCLRRPPTAVVAFSDEVAFGALLTLRRAGVGVPERISVVGIDDHELAEAFDLTTVRQPVTEQGVRAGELVRQVLTGREPEESQVELPCRLVLRGTTGAPRPT
ncbi:LacI family DNA-binding transcriptional regulator [Pseudokineococcus basanitobsidens]|uniref:LacI family DNA-binding transcriptional regulator n=1 Tax=Pseudokineococcus basanitobsidens TaxID=1926649 RepID=A0ABU8RIB6_9ACTN